MENVTNSCATPLTGTSQQLFLTLIQTLFTLQCNIAPPQMPTQQQPQDTPNIYDFIIVGAGSAGAVIANRLSENPQNSILLLESDTVPSTTSQIPSLFPTLQSTEEAWRHTVESQKALSCMAMEKGQCWWHTGKALGGSSTINAMMYVRGNSRDYDRWQAEGCTGWNWESALHYFKKSEDNQEYAPSHYHNCGGPLIVSNYSYPVPLTDALFAGARELNVPTVSDLNGGTYIHYGYAQGTVYNGTRFSTYRAFIYPAHARPNLKIITKAFVTKVITMRGNNSNPVAKEVMYTINGKSYKATSRKEVILSAGALNTPKILMLSGIGPKQDLEKLNISVIKDLPVGQNLQDHLMHLGLFITVPKSLEWITDPVDSTYQYIKNKTGFLSTIGMSNVNGFINTLFDNGTYPDLQITHNYFQKGDQFNFQIFCKEHHFNQAFIDSTMNIIQNRSVLSIIPILLKPKSKGFVKLRSANPLDELVFVSNYLQDSADLETLLRGVKFVKKLLKTKPFTSLKPDIPEILNLNLPNCVMFPFNADAYWKCSIRSTSSTIFHYCGTAKMGAIGARDAVVDPTLKEQGVKGLRVADASIMPNIVSGNTNAPCIMIGEKAADLIKADWAGN